MPRRLCLEGLEDRATPATLFVAPDGTDAGATSSAASPFRTLQYAATKAATNDTVLVAAGTYTFDAAAYANPTGTAGGPGSDLYTALGTDAVLIVKNKRLTVNGGYARADGFAVSNPAGNPTVIDGQGARRGLLVVGVGAAAGTGLDLNGITFTNGRADAGGGALVDFTDAAARPGQLKVKFSNVTFRGNAAAGDAAAGGALGLRFAGDVSLSNVVFDGNAAVGGPAEGGAVHAVDSNLSATDVRFDGNRAEAGDGDGPSADGGDAAGGAVALRGGTATLSRVTATGNTADGGDAATVPGAALGGAIYAAGATVAVTDAVIEGNRAIGGAAPNAVGTVDGAAGAGVLADRTALTLTRVAIVNNTASARSAAEVTGAGLYAYVHVAGVAALTVTVTNSVIAGNRAVAGSAAGARFDHVRATLNHTTVANNTLEGATAVGAAVVVGTVADPATLGAAELNLFESIVAGNVGTGAAAVSVFPRATVTFRGSLLANPGSAAEVRADPDPTAPDAGTIAGLTTNLPAADPLFTGAEDFSLRSGSPAIDAGTASTVATDIGGAARTGVPDLGAYELGTPGTAPDVGTPTGAGSAAGANTPPTISAVAGVTLVPGASSGPLAVTVGDSQTDAALLTVTATSGDTVLVPPTGVALGGAGANRTITITPAAGRTGTAAITITVRDAGGLLATTSFTVTVTPTDAPGRLGTRQFAVGGDAGSGAAALHNADGSVRYTLTPFPGFAGGVRVAAADFTGDGVADLVVGTGPGTATRVRVLDGVTQVEVFAVAPFEATFTGGVYVAAGDLTGDGRPELVVTPDEGGGPRVLVYDVPGAAQRASFFGIDDPTFRGGARAAVGDLDGDGTADLAVAAGFQGGPRVAGYDGPSAVAGTPTRLFGDFFAFETALRNGTYVALGDVDGDGFADLIAGGGPGGGPRVTVYSGQSLRTNSYTVLANFFGGDAAGRGGVRVAAKNLDGDGRADILTGAGTAAGGAVTAYFGAALSPGSAAAGFDIEAFDGFAGGVFVG